MLLSDIPRSGYSVNGFMATYKFLEPDGMQLYGPWSYSVQRLTRTNATDTLTPVWPYKFDTTSTVWRAFAQLFNLTSFPPCVRYASACPSENMNSSFVFDIMDSMADAVANVSSTYQFQNSKGLGPTAVAMRSQANYVDRLHHYLLPQLFRNPSWRTNQAIYFGADLAARPDFGVCRRSAARPLACNELWLNSRRSCAPGDPRCFHGGLVWDHITRHLRAVQGAFPDLQVDLTVLESSEDARVCRGLSITGRRYVDVDYRYEGGLLTSDALERYRVVAYLRLFGQLYFFVRVLFLLGSCYVTRVAEEKYQLASRRNKVKAAARVFVRLPSHAIIYGSPLPVICYIVAHLVDAPTTYEMVSHQFDPGWAFSTSALRTTLRSQPSKCAMSGS
ncbi:TPA: hypothetical protein N0F65_004978 [Lagenidium giganteum]|uniref:Uncharacterized protein n=1 Tax=Lagenidium giganteum TaxID=4803 RepID=A0AAV2ZCF7_9STRA|nr:TPA: hypothetical protein N0F65_004978 [Lagenidium giganteum]